MKRRGPLFTLFLFVLLIGTWFGIDLVQSRRPLLGLDLQGGLSAIYSPVEQTSQDSLIVIRDLMRDQLTSFGIAEPDVRVEGSNIVVDLPGVSDTTQAFEALQVSGIVTLRPVLQCGTAPPPDTSGTAADQTNTDGPTNEQVSGIDSGTGSDSGTVEGSTVDGSTVDGSTVDGSTVDTPSSGSASDETSIGPIDSGAGVATGARRPMVFHSPFTTPDTTPDTSSDGTSGTAPDTGSTDAGTTTPDPVVSTPDGTVPITSIPTDPVVVSTPPVDPIQTDGQTILPYPAAGQICLVGPPGGTGEVFERGSANPGIDPQTGEWLVSVSLKPEGSAIWNQLATECYNATQECPSTQLAIALDDQIKSAPTVNEPVFNSGVQISGSFSEEEADSLANTLNRGAFPVAVEQQRLETVSPTAGTNSLNAAIVAGLIGVALMLLFMILYYRRLALVIIPGLLVWGMTVYTLATFVSRSSNYALTLAGVTGMIVAVGVTVDTYVVYFERLREEVRHGRTYRNSAQRSFRVTWRTILSADLVSLLASFVLFLLSVGSVKGFALYLGLTTICDLVVFYFFTRPFVAVLARNGWLDRGVSQPGTAPVGATS